MGGGPFALRNELAPRPVRAGDAMADTTTSHDASPLSTAGLPSYRGISEVTAIETHSGRILLVLSLCTARHTELVEISSSTGRLLPRRQDWRFDSHRDALEYVRGSGFRRVGATIEKRE